jgi:hypothetical protein
MKRASPRPSPRLVWSIVLLLLANTAIFAENIDPNNDGSKYAWSENLGWLNARPGGPSGPGVQVGDSSLTGWIWSENAGWISLSCANTSACGTSSYGVVNDACGGLSGRAWSENAGWIDFAPTTCAGDPSCGVKIGPTTGIFSGRAWSENAGWITFSATSPVAYQVVTSWRSMAPPPAGSPSVTAGKTGGNLILSWTALAGATTYDVVQGLLSTLRSSHGIPWRLGPGCQRQAHWSPSSGRARETASGSSSAGRGGRDVQLAGGAGPRDAGIAASGNGCP